MRRWGEPLIHAAIAAVFVWFLHPTWLAVSVNTLWWAQREWEQRRLRGKDPWNWSAQNWREALAPAVAGLATALIKQILAV